ncbi:hypothetical protein PBY51_010198 [Eleginops maclovinus]|uniref:Uncharacterized protein n=1 Tax=Eleginops maclovinus TaxID=56733 RepID=A0AAN8AEH5_ELEMC|nr:hypothetical protein PBY51_010198 [Eleginops maclovinus]
MTHCSDNDEQNDAGAETVSSIQKKRSKGEKRVSFPPDEQIVSSFAEHRDREADGRFTLMEVMEAYEQSCSRHQVQPREQVLQQLQACMSRGLHQETHRPWTSMCLHKP